MVRTNKSRKEIMVETIESLKQEFKVIDIDSNNLLSRDNRDLMDLIVFHHDLETLIKDIDALTLNQGLLDETRFNIIKSVTPEVLSGIKDLYIRTKSKTRPEIFAAMFVQLLQQGTDFESLKRVMERTIAIEGMVEDEATATIEKMEAERLEGAIPEVAIDLNTNTEEENNMENISNMTYEQIEESLKNVTDEMRDAFTSGYESAKEEIDEAINKFTDNLKQLEEEAEKKQEEKSSLVSKLLIGAGVGLIVGVGIWAYKTYFSEGE
jgi:hypothetical protein|nr:MAG TPA: protein of unknown function (DUF883) [Caudoviricetes sp.]